MLACHIVDFFFKGEKFDDVQRKNNFLQLNTIIHGLYSKKIPLLY